jgi:hypothetical protein
MSPSTIANQMRLGEGLEHDVAVDDREPEGDHVRRSVPVDGRDLNGLLCFDEGPDLVVGHPDFVSALGHVRLLVAECRGCARRV